MRGVRGYDGAGESGTRGAGTGSARPSERVRTSLCALQVHDVVRRVPKRVQHLLICDDFGGWRVPAGEVCSRTRAVRLLRLPGAGGLQKGYYGVENEYVCKATALFIHRHGAACYTQTLERAMAAGVKYPEDYDARGSVDKALELLEQHSV